MFHPTFRFLNATIHSITLFLRETPKKEEGITKTYPMLTPMSYKKGILHHYIYKKWKNKMMGKYAIHNKEKGG